MLQLQLFGTVLGHDSVVYDFFLSTTMVEIVLENFLQTCTSN